MAEGMGMGGKSAAGTVSAQAEDAARSTTDALRAGKDEAVVQTKAMVRDMADEQRRKAAESISGMAQALHRSAQDLEQESGLMSRYTHMAAEQLDEVSSYLRKSDLNDILEGAENFARRQPYWFVGGAVAAGFLLARFLKSSGADEYQGEGYRRSSAPYAPGSTAAPDYGPTVSPYGSTVTGTTPASTGELP